MSLWSERNEGIKQVHTRAISAFCTTKNLWLSGILNLLSSRGPEKAFFRKWFGAELWRIVRGNQAKGRIEGRRRGSKWETSFAKVLRYKWAWDFWRNGKKAPLLHHWLFLILLYFLYNVYHKWHIYIYIDKYLYIYLVYPARTQLHLKLCQVLSA